MSDPVVMQRGAVRILGFDSWTRGSHHFARLVDAFARRNATLRLVHLGSWGNDVGRPVQERIGGLPATDIAFYGNSFERVLDVERPDAVIFLSTQTFAHRAFLRYCRQRGIPTLLLYHGLASMQVTNDKRGSFRVARGAYAKFIWSKLAKTFRRTLPSYAGALLRTRASAADWRRFAGDIGRMVYGSGSWELAKAADARASRCAVYTNADVEHARRVFGFQALDVLAVGNPDLSRFGFAPDMLGCALRSSGSAPVQTVMYIDTGLIATGLVFESRKSFIDHILNTARVLAAHGTTLLFKAHPGHDPEFLRDSFAGTGVELVSNEDFVPTLRACAACIVEPTTLALVPALMGVPLLYANYGDLSELRYGPVLTSYPRGQLLRQIEAFPTVLAEVFATDRTGATTEWAQLNSGPLPAEEMPDRVAELVLSMFAPAAQHSDGRRPLVSAAN